MPDEVSVEQPHCYHDPGSGQLFYTAYPRPYWRALPELDAAMAVQVEYKKLVAQVTGPEKGQYEDAGQRLWREAIDALRALIEALRWSPSVHINCAQAQWEMINLAPDTSLMKIKEKLLAAIARADKVLQG